MAGVHDLALFIAAGLLLNITPGPDTLYIVGQSVANGARYGAVAALGIAAGCCLHAVAAAVGVSALLLASPTAFTVLKWVGGAYLAWLGVAMLRSGGPREVPRAAVGATLARVFLQGVVTNALNPKVALFFVAFLPQFVDPRADHRLVPLLLLGLVFNVNATLWNLFTAWLAGRIGTALLRGRGLVGWVTRGTGVLLITVGLRLAFAAPP